jgi:hypothetical protein
VDNGDRGVDSPFRTDNAEVSRSSASYSAIDETANKFVAEYRKALRTFEQRFHSRRGFKNRIDSEFRFNRNVNMHRHDLVTVTVIVRNCLAPCPPGGRGKK